MAWRDATPDEIAAYQGSTASTGKWRDATPEEVSAYKDNTAGTFTGVRPQQTATGEIGSGLKSVGEAASKLISDPLSVVRPPTMEVSPEIPRPGFLQQGLQSLLENPVVKGAGGAMQAFAGALGLHHLTNAISTGSESLANVLEKTDIGKANIPGTTKSVADVVGGTGQAAGDVLSQILLGKGIGTLSNYLKGISATTTEKTAAEAAAKGALESNQAASEAAINTTALNERNRAIDLAARKKSMLPTAADAAALAGPNDVPTSAAGVRGAIGESKAARTATKDQLYADMKDAATGMEGDRSNYNEAAKSILGEKGVAGIFPTKAEAAAGKVTEAATGAGGIDEAAVADQIDALQKQIAAAPTSVERITAEQALQEFVKSSDLPAKPTVPDLINEQKRINAAIGASANNNLSRQLNILKDGVEKDILAADPSGKVADSLRVADSYYKNDYAPFFSRKSEITNALKANDPALIEQLVPKANDKLRVDKTDRLMSLMDTPERQKQLGDGLLGGMVNNAGQAKDFGSGIKAEWAKYADPNSSDKVLKATLGNRYTPMKSLVDTMSAVHPRTIDAALEKVIGKPTVGFGDLRSIEAQGSIEVNRAKQLTALKQEYADKIAALVPETAKKAVSSRIGLAATMYGTVGLIAGTLVTGTPMAKIMTGGLIMLGGPAIERLLYSGKGIDLLTKAMRATPGTANASAQARLIKQYLETGASNNAALPQ